eukprot:7380465-Prymnesium_polylepis.2
MSCGRLRRAWAWRARPPRTSATLTKARRRSSRSRSSLTACSWEGLVVPRAGVRFEESYALSPPPPAPAPTGPPRAPGDLARCSPGRTRPAALHRRASPAPSTPPLVQQSSPAAPAHTPRRRRRGLRDDRRPLLCLQTAAPTREVGPSARSRVGLGCTACHSSYSH